MRIVFFGTPQFAKTILEYLFQQHVDIAAVITRPDKPKGRSGKPSCSPVKEFALEHHLPLYQPPKASDPEFATFLQTLQADFFIVAAYAEILKEIVLTIPRLGCINVHGSILPKYRGAAPVQRSIIEGETETGVTIMKMAVQLDAGDILSIHKTPIPPDMNTGELMAVLADLGKVALYEAMQGVEQEQFKRKNKIRLLLAQAKKLTPEEGRIDWNLPSQVLHNKVRGFTPNPGAWVYVTLKGEKKRLLIKKTHPEPAISGTPGSILSQTKIGAHCRMWRGKSPYSRAPTRREESDVS